MFKYDPDQPLKTVNTFFKYGNYITGTDHVTTTRIRKYNYFF
jgi:hypothetical protein